ncbi:hypothetical protein A1O1_04115 [Capronia coronata CBS 617.96]|uniref:Uncharacterized protein n=1 Tax=Capronia coronata CBS 617.96 TaxID=1182541 RepID=W9YEP7_9EURO|nr:uncharacterized protein A1O1_04115 [Capronia coronata CBS 617.96]EXJ91008.1 hypothetical protein A1O1_04115 [Capronia coronata CBS 617.96]
MQEAYVKTRFCCITKRYDGGARASPQACEQVNLVDQVRPSIFSNKSDERVLHRDGGLQSVIVDQKYKRPDLVVGLSLTTSFVPHIGQLSPDRYSPFKDGYTCFPFLVVEAKSEKAGPGFEAIQRQSALAIRSCLKLQVDLETDSGNELLHPLVWFIGYQGDEWRLYCAIPNGDETNVVDCWHGYLANEDQALQLLLIMDWICYWARDVYREAVLKCMTAVTSLDRGVTPAETEFSAYSDGTGDLLYSRTISLPLRSSRPPLVRPVVFSQHPEASDAGQVRESLDEFAEDTTMGDLSSSVEDNQGGAVTDSTSAITVVDASNLLVEWKHLSIPEEEKELLEMIRSGLWDKSFREIAWELLEVLTDDAHTVRLSRRVVRDLWEGRPESPDHEFEDEEPISTLVVFRSRFDEATWQVVQSYTVITCSQEAAQQLAIVARAGESVTLPLSYWKAHNCDCLMIAANAFQSISGRQSALLAGSQEVYCLVPDDLGHPGVHSRWERYDRSQSKLLLGRIETVVNNMGDRTPELARFANRASQRYPSIDHLFDTRTIDNLPGILLKRPVLWPAGGPLWCFLTFEPTHPENIEQQLALVRDGKGIFAADDLTNEDHQSLAEAIAQMYVDAE